MAEFQEVIRQARRMCERYSSTCDDCYRRRIPAEIAEKLGIKPKEGK